MRQFLHHAFIPSELNNHRAKLLHHHILFSVVICLFVLALIIHPLKNMFPQVLGTSIDISIPELLQLTNQERDDEGLSPLSLDSNLTAAAQMKAKDMFAKNYWAHIAPDGTTPWIFIKQSGYNYVYAGENLARGFNSSSDVMKAWMASPAHRGNIVSSKYKDIGFAISEGKLLSEDTVLVVEMFGSTTLGAVDEAAPLEKEKTNQETKATSVLGVPQEALFLTNKPLINSISLSKTIDIVVIAMFLLVLVLDFVIITKKKVVRVVGHNIDHLLFLSTIFLFAVLMLKGVVL